MSELITIEVKSKSGTINQLQVAEIISIDGKPYTPSGDIDQLLCAVNQMAGRVTALENIISQGA